MSKEEDWRGKFERSEAARLKLRETLVLLKEKALNTEQLVKQHTELKAELAAEKKAKQKAESAASKLKKDKDEMKTRVARLEEHVSQLQSQMAVVLNQHHPGGILANGSAVLDIVTRTEMNALQKQVKGLEKQFGVWNNVIKELQDEERGGGGGGGGAGGISKKRPAAPIEGADPARARAIAILKGNKAPIGTEKHQQKQRPQLPPKKRVRLDEDKQQQQQFLIVGGSAGGSEAAPPGFADVAIAALRAVMGADAEQPPSTAAVEDAVKILGPLGTSNNIDNIINNGGGGGSGVTTSSISSQKRNIIAAFSCAVLECAAAAPARRFAAASLSPQHWFSGTKVQQASGSKSKRAAATPTTQNSTAEVQEKVPTKIASSLPSFLGVWCSSEVLQRHSLPWLLHCAAEISIANAAAAGACDTPVESNICQILAKDLALLVIKDVATSSPRPLLHSPTELCAAAAAAAALWRFQSDFRSFQGFLLDILLSKRGNNEENVLAPLAAAIESWPEAVFLNKGALGSGFHGVLQYAAVVGGQRSPLLEIRLAAMWLRKIGIEQWNWKEDLNEEDAEALGFEGRKQLAKFEASILASVKT